MMGVRAHAQVRIERSERVREPEGGRDRGREGGSGGRGGSRGADTWRESESEGDLVCARAESARAHTCTHIHTLSQDAVA